MSVTADEAKRLQHNLKVPLIKINAKKIFFYLKQLTWIVCKFFIATITGKISEIKKKNLFPPYN